MQIVEKVGKILRAHGEEELVERIHHCITFSGEKTRVVELVMQRFAFSV